MPRPACTSSAPTASPPWTGTGSLSPSLFGDGVIVDLTGPRTGLFLGTAPCARLPQLPGGLPDDVLLAAGSAVGLETASLTPQEFTALDGTDVGLLLGTGPGPGPGLGGGRTTGVGRYLRPREPQPAPASRLRSTSALPASTRYVRTGSAASSGSSRSETAGTRATWGACSRWRFSRAGSRAGNSPGGIDPLVTDDGHVSPGIRASSELFTDFGHDFLSESGSETP